MQLENYHEELPHLREGIDDGGRCLQLLQLAAWDEVQDAFPDTPIEQRDMLILGTHPDCWKKMRAFLD